MYTVHYTQYAVHCTLNLHTLSGEMYNLYNELYTFLRGRRGELFIRGWNLKWIHLVSTTHEVKQADLLDNTHCFITENKKGPWLLSTWEKLSNWNVHLEPSLGQTCSILWIRVSLVRILQTNLLLPLKILWNWCKNVFCCCFFCFFLDKVVELVGGGYVISGPTLSSS